MTAQAAENEARRNAAWRFIEAFGGGDYWVAKRWAVDRALGFAQLPLFDDPDGLLLTLLIDEEAGGLRFFVNDRMGLYLEGVGGYTSDIGPAVLSGTDVDFGTRCDFTDMVLWNIQ